MANADDFLGYEQPGIGKVGEIEDCSIGVTGDPGVVTVTFSHLSGETLLVLDPTYAELLADWLVKMAKKSRAPHLSVMGKD